MSRDAWLLIKQSKRFYVYTFRKVGSALLISIAVNLLLSLAIYYVYFDRPEHRFYATNGEMPPIMLSALHAPNLSSEALLDPDPNEMNDAKYIPQ